MSNSSTHPILWDESTVIEDKDGKRYSWALPRGFRGSQHLMTWGRQLLCGQFGGYGGHDRPFGSERACKVCIAKALKLVEAREAKQAAPVAVEFTPAQLEALFALVDRGQRAYKSDSEYYAARLANAAQDDPNRDVIESNVNYTTELATEAVAGALLSLISNARI